MQFDQRQLDYFNASSGAYSEATEREIYDSQITATDYEALLLFDYFDYDQIHRGNVKSNPDAASKPFKIHPSGESVELNLVFPKPGKDELRLYLRKGVFKPREGAVWYLFVRNSEMWLGQMSQTVWRGRFLEGTDNAEENLLDDDASADFQQVLNDQSGTARAVPDLVLRSGQHFARSAKVARDAIRNSGFCCEVYPEYPSFTSRVTAKPYVEAHHFIPMGLQGSFASSLDVESNICVLNPTVHRLVHSGVISEVEPVVEQLFEHRKDFVHGIGLVLDDIRNIYLKL
ncbi:MAG: hypothetical protein ABJN34_15770 [Litoreibacter sp.]|uniref:hypothetical protein n=1 Tax=Litoreibacter sp. TaxID=1969459 RepID=UPI00329A1179